MIKFIASLLGLSSLSLYAAPSSDLWDFWQASNEENTTQFNHSQWQTFRSLHQVIFEHSNVYA